MTLTNAPAARPSRLGNVLVALLYLALALWVQRSILSAPGTMVPMPTAMVGTPVSILYQGDQRFVVGAIGSNLLRLLRDPSALGGLGLCYPLRASYTLGEHMLGETLLALPSFALTRDPILSYNAVVVLSIWIAALTMYALALHWTRSAPAAFVAGMLFAFTAARLSNPGHPFVHGNHWTPLALLLVNRLFERQRWRDAAALALVISLQLLESFYQVLGLAILGGTYGIFLLFRHRRELLALAPKLIAVAAVSATTTWLVFGPYLHTRALWGVLQGRPGTLLNHPGDYLPGGSATAGLVALVLATIGLADRCRGKRAVAGQDPRLVFTVAGFLVFWSTLYTFRAPVLPLFVPNPLLLLGNVVPGLDAVRVLGAMRFGVYLVVSFLAAYGVLVLTERLGTRARHAVAALLAVLVLLEAYDPSGTLVGRPAALTAYRVYPSVAVVKQLQRLPQGAVLDLPFRFKDGGKILQMPYYITLAAYHGRPSAACYNSFSSPLQDEVTRRTDALPDAAAADALYAMGFRTVFVHRKGMEGGSAAPLEPLLNDPARMKRIGEGDKTARYTLSSPVPVLESLTAIALADGATSQPAADVGAPAARVDFDFANRTTSTFRHPTFLPVPLAARWYDASGSLIATSVATGMLPIVLTSGEQVTRSLVLDVPPTVASGVYRIDVAPQEQPDLILARREVRVS